MVHSEPFPVGEGNHCRFPERALGSVGLPSPSQRTANPAGNTLVAASGGRVGQAACVSGAALPGAQSKHQQLGTDNSYRSLRGAYYK